MCVSSDMPKNMVVTKTRNSGTAEQRNELQYGTTWNTRNNAKIAEQ